MKRWFCGFSSITDSSKIAFPQPIDGKIVWEGANSFWVCGNWAKQQVTTIFAASVRLAIVGTCLAPYQTLVELFQNAIAKNDYSQLIRLPGNYNAIVQDQTDTYIFVDVAGLRPIFYTVYDSLIVYSSLAVALQQLIKADLDPSWIANSLAGLTTLNPLLNRSPFCNIQTIPPGHYLHISAGKATCKRYWNGPQEYISFSEAAEKLREQLLTAVQGRVHLYGNITSDLSGGFDSTSLALIAAKSLAREGNKLHTITFKSVSESEDAKWATRAANLYPNIASIMIESHEVPEEYSNLQSIPLTDAPEPSAIDIGQIGYEMGIIKSKGSQLHLSGEGGDAVLLASHSYLADLLRRGQFKTFFQHAYGWSRVNNLSPIDLIRSAVGLSFTSYHQWWRQQAKKLMTEQILSQSLINQPYISKIMGWDAVPDVTNWCTKKTVDLVVAEVHKWGDIGTPFSNSPAQQNSIMTIHGSAIHSLIQQQLADTYGVNLEFPFLDSLVIDACLSALPEERSNPFVFKPLLVKALEKDLPQSIFTRTTKGEYTVDDIVGVRKNMAGINELFQTSLLADMGLIDMEKFQDYMQQLSMGLVGSSWHFEQALVTEIWLRRLAEAKNSFWMEIKP